MPKRLVRTLGVPVSDKQGREMPNKFRENLAVGLFFAGCAVMVLYIIGVIAAAFSGIAQIIILAIQGNAICLRVVGLGIVIILIVCLSKTSRDILGYH